MALIGSLSLNGKSSVFHLYLNGELASVIDYNSGRDSNDNALWYSGYRVGLRIRCQGFENHLENGHSIKRTSIRL